MDYDSSSKFISSLAKFLQSLCNGYVEFDSGVQVIGHLYLSVDTGKTIDYILNEKVCKTDENSVTFISNSFHAQPAEKPRPPDKKAKDSDKSDLKYEDNSDNFINAQGEPQSTNIGTLPPARNVNRNSPHPQLTKRPYSPSHKPHSKSGRTSPRHKKSKMESFDQNISNPASENSFSSAPSPVIETGSLNAVSVNSSDAPHPPHLNESYQQSYFQPDEESSVADDSEERDIKPSIDTDVTFIKEEYAPPSSCSQSGNQGRDRNNDDESAYPYQSNPVFPGSYPGGFGASQRSNFNSSGSSHMFSPGQSSSHLEDNSGDPSACLDEQSLKKIIALASGEHNSSIIDMAGTSHLQYLSSPNNKNFSCHLCGKVFRVKHQYIGHLNTHLNQKPFRCEFCDKSFAYATNLSRHRRTCENNPQNAFSPENLTFCFQDSGSN